MDRISDLPDSLLCKILSYVPVKHAVAASILSTRWRRISPFDFPPINLDFDDSLLLYFPNSFSPYTNSLNFPIFVKNLLADALYDGVPCVESITLKSNKCYSNDDYIAYAVWAAPQLNVSQLIIQSLFPPQKSNNFFRYLNRCTTLVRLELEGDYRLYTPDNFNLPSLKKLYLCKLTFDNDNGAGSINELISGCPILEDLQLTSCKMFHLEHLHIRSPLLKKFIFTKNNHCSLVINVPSLEVLKCAGNFCIAAGFSMPNFKFLTVACIEAARHNNVGIARLVNACSSTVKLRLNAASIEALHQSHVALSTFQKSAWMTLSRPGFQSLAHFLCCAPNLQKLTIDGGIDVNGGGYAEFEFILPNTPTCLEMHIKEIEFVNFMKSDDEIKLIEYFLKTGKTLQKLILNCTSLEHTILKGFQMLPSQARIVYEPFLNENRIMVIKSDFSLARR